MNDWKTMTEILDNTPVPVGGISHDGIVDLRSDTVTRPTDAMWEAMKTATLRDDTLEGDPTVALLEHEAALTLGKEGALFVCSGTMGNTIATLVHAPRGGEAIVDAHAHMAHSEGGALSRLAGLFCRMVPSTRGEMDLAVLADVARGGFSRYGEPTAIIAVETTHNASGGYVPSMHYMQGIASLGAERGIAIHIDGARLFNAAVALRQPVSALAGCADSVTFCLSKGLGAPMGAILAGDADFILRARTLRRQVGGGLRQAGIMAAAGLVALREMPARLQEDHDRAHRLWNGLAHTNRIERDDIAPQSNIVRLRVPDGRAEAYCQRLATAGILVRANGAHAIRVVTHRHVTNAGIDQAIHAFRAL